MKYWLYEGRQGQKRLFSGDRDGFDKAREAQDDDNRITLEEILELDDNEVGGSFEEGHFYIDDGGDIELLTCEDPLDGLTTRQLDAAYRRGYEDGKQA